MKVEIRPTGFDIIIDGKVLGVEYKPIEECPKPLTLNDYHHYILENFRNQRGKNEN